MPQLMTIDFVPGAILAGAAVNLPSWAPKIDAVASASIRRPTSQLTLSNHAQADVIAALADHAAADIIASIADHPAADVIASIADHPAADIAASIADHAVHGHDITMVVAAGGGGAVTAPAIAGPLESAGGAATMTGAVDALAAAQAHAAGAAATAHAAGAAATAHAAGAAATAHAAGGAAVAHALTGASPTVAAVPTKSDEDTITLDVNTLAGDILYLTYIPQGYRLVA